MKKSNRQDGRPAFLFFPNDWLSSPDLNSCSLEAQGLWIKMLCYIYQSPKKGVLLLPSGKQIESKTLAKLCGEEEQKISILLSELEETGTFSRLEDGTIYCRRVKRESDLIEARREAGRLGGLKQKRSKDESKSEATLENEDESIIQPTSNNINVTEVDKLPEKEKPTKEKFSEFVLLKQEEHEKLIEKFGEKETTQMIERLNNYIGSSGRRYKSHYHTILQWAEKDKKENKTDGQKDDSGKYKNVPVLRAEDM
jgi:hypothetical protein